MHFVGKPCFQLGFPLLFSNQIRPASQATPTGTIETVPGYEPAFKATVNFGADWLRFDPDGSHGRIDLRGIAK